MKELLEHTFWLAGGCLGAFLLLVGLATWNRTVLLIGLVLYLFATLYAVFIVMIWHIKCTRKSKAEEELKKLEKNIEEIVDSFEHD